MQISSNGPCYIMPWIKFFENEKKYSVLMENKVTNEWLK
jgi:hypothetical protein